MEVDETLTLDDVEYTLSQLDLFFELSDEELAELAQLVTQESFAAGQDIVRYYDVMTHLMIVERGHLQAYTQLSNGRVRVEEEFVAGSDKRSFSDAWLFQTALSPYHVRAHTDSLVLYLEQSKFQAFLNTHDGLLERLDLSRDAQSKLPMTFAEKRRYLGTVKIFSELSESSLTAVARMTQQYSFSAESVILHQRDVAEGLYIVESGRLESFHVDDNGFSERRARYLPGDSFDDTWLFEVVNHPASVRAKRDGRLLFLPRAAFQGYLDSGGADRSILSQLNLSETAKADLERSHYSKPTKEYKGVSLIPGELIEFNTRRSVLVLALKSVLPFIGMIGVPILLFLLVNNLFGFSTTTSILLACLPFVIFLGVILVYFLDWRNDYLIVTNKRLIYYQYDLTSFRGNGNNLEINKVQSVETARPNWLQNLFNLGTVRITSSSQTAVIFFDYIREPERIKDAVNKLREQERSVSEANFKADMRRSVENYFEVSDPLQALPDKAPPPPAPTKAQVTRARIRAGFKWLFKPYQTRIEDKSNNVITYRKHWISLLPPMAWPFGFAVLLVIIWLMVSLFTTTSPLLNGIMIVGLLIDILAIVWIFEDWRNDTFKLNQRYVIDIDRMPFGFAESRKQAQLDNIQNVEAMKPNVLATIFNFGNVDIETAGAQNDIVFENVANPEGVKDDIFKMADKYKESQQKQGRERQRKEYAVLLDVFMQENELGRVRRRTPDFERFEDLLTERATNATDNE